MFGRTYLCGEVTEAAIGEKVKLKGWVQKRRDLGGLIFIDLRDRKGLFKLFSIQMYQQKLWRLLKKFVTNMLLMLKVQLSNVMKQTINPNIQQVKLKCKFENITILNEAKTPPFIY